MLYDIDHRGNTWYIVTNYEAKNFRLMTAPQDKTAKSGWTELIAHRPDVLVEGIGLVQGFPRGV